MTSTRLAAAIFDEPPVMLTVHADRPMTRAERFEHDFLPYLDRVYRAALCLTRDPAAAEELVIETFARAYQVLSWFQPAAGRQVWLYRILVAAHWDHRPAGRPAGPGPVRDQPPIRRALRELPEYLRFAVHLADVDGFSYEEIAEITGTTPVTVAARLRDARRSLRRRLSTSTGHGP